MVDVTIDVMLDARGKPGSRDLPGNRITSAANSVRSARGANQVDRLGGPAPGGESLAEGDRLTVFRHRERPSSPPRPPNTDLDSRSYLNT